MAVINAYVNSSVAAGKIVHASKIQAGQIFSFATTFEVAADNDDNSIFRLMQLNPNLIPVKIEVLHDSITSGTDYDLGLYKPGASGAVIAVDVFADALNLSSAGNKDGLTSVDIVSRTKKIWEHASHTIRTKLPGYDLALKANTVGSAAGTITVIASFIQG